MASGAGRLEGRVACITGSASGIGLAIARRFVAEGARVALGDLSAERLDEAKAELGEAATTAVADVRAEADVERLVESAVSAFGRLDVGVNCAGLATFAPVREQTEAQWDEVLDVCLKGVFLSTKHEARRMQRGGVVINVASINARVPGEGMSAYCSAKAGVEMLTRCAALELAPQGIRVVGIGPGFVETPLTAFAREMPAIGRAYLESIPLGRTGRPEDVASAALFLASEDASWVAGETLFVDGAEQLRGYPPMLRLAAEARAAGGAADPGGATSEGGAAGGER